MRSIFWILGAVLAVATSLGAADERPTATAQSDGKPLYSVVGRVFDNSGKPLANTAVQLGPYRSLSGRIVKRRSSAFAFSNSVRAIAFFESISRAWRRRSRAREHSPCSTSSWL